MPRQRVTIYIMSRYQRNTLLRSTIATYYILPCMRLSVSESLYSLCHTNTHTFIRQSVGEACCRNRKHRREIIDRVDIPPVLSTCPLHTISGCGKERRILIGPWWPANAALVRNYLEVYWPCAGGLSAVNAIGTQLRDPILLGLTRWRLAVWYKYMDAAAELRGNPVSKHQIQPEYGDEQADAGRDCRTRLARPISQARTRTGKKSFSLFSWPRAGLATLPGWSILLLCVWP